MRKSVKGKGVIEHIVQIDSLIRKKAAGSPKSLSLKIGLSEGYTKQLIAKMRSYGAKIICTHERGYVYEDEGIAFFVGYLRVGSGDHQKI